MSVSEETVLSLVEDFNNAALQGRGWYEALDRFAKATGSTTGELIGLGSNAAVPFNIMTDIDPGFQPAFVAAGGGDPLVNPRVRAGFRMPLMQSATDYEFISPAVYRRDRHYQEFAIPWDVPHICLANLEKGPDMLVGLAVVRTAREGVIEPHQRALFDVALPHIRLAVRTQVALENQGALLLSRTLEGLGMAAFLCDQRARVQGMTPAAEKLVEGGAPLSLVAGQLRTSRRDNQAILATALTEVAFSVVRPGKPVARTIVLRAESGSQPLLLDLVQLTRMEHELTFNPKVLIVARTARQDGGQRGAILRQAFGLTAAEADVAIRIARGESTAEIAESRRSTLGTVRIQLKSVMVKMQVRRQTEIAAKVASFYQEGFAYNSYPI